MSYVGLIDCNNFFVSCERLFRPDLALRPVLVLSSNDGCVISRSREVKQLGIPMGIPFFEIRDLVKKTGITVFSSNFVLYRDISLRVMETIEDVVGECSVYSIDEAFFDVPTPGDPVEFGTMLRSRVMRDVGIPVSVGMAGTKTLAKLAGERAKNEETGIGFISEEEELDLGEVPLSALWGVGRSTSERLKKAGIATVKDVRDRGVGTLRNLLGVHGARLYLELSGTQATVEGTERSHHSIMSSRSFGVPASEVGIVEDAVTHHTAHLAEELRSNGEVALYATLYIRWTEDGASRYATIPVGFEKPTSDTRLMLRPLIRALRDHHRCGRRYKKAGVVVSGLCPKGQSTGVLFENGEQDSDALMKAVDRLNRRHGHATIRIGTERKNPLWKAKDEYISKPYTTSWNALPSVRNDL